jgi:hypothetical protein
VSALGDVEASAEALADAVAAALGAGLADGVAPGKETPSGAIKGPITEDVFAKLSLTVPLSSGWIGR